MSPTVVIVVLFVATYPSRAVALLRPSWVRPSPRVRRHLHLLGPAVLAASATTAALLPAGRIGAMPALGAPAVGTVACAAVVGRGGRLVTGLAAAVALALLARHTGRP